MRTILVQWQRALGIISLVASLHFLSEAATAANPRPNIILIMTDDQGYGDLGCHGNTMIRTPHLDRLHGESVRLTDFHVDPTCSPTRAALMTGRYSTRTGVWHTIMGRSLMYGSESTLAEILAQAGYETGIFGKWHLGDNYPMRPQDQGFDEVLVHGGGGIGQTPDHWGNDYFDDTYLHNGRPVSYEGYCTDVFFSLATAFIDRQRNANKPFFVYLPTNVPHSPYQVPESYRRYYEERRTTPTMARFYGMIENLDENVGRLLAQLQSWQLEQNTILIFMTDNGTAEGLPWPGAPAPEPDQWPGFNAGMRGKKGSEYEGGHRVPFFIRWPGGNVGGGRDIPQLSAHIDVLPTLLDLAGIDPPSAVRLDGTSLAPLLRGDASSWSERTLFVHSQRIEYPKKWRKSSVMTERWRLVNGQELYDIVQDPGQKSDISKAEPETVNRLRSAYEAWWESLQPVFNDHAWIGIGAPEENPALLTCHDWHSNHVPWHHGMIKKMPQANGYWMVEVIHDGEYAFTLRHQPVDAKFPLQATRARIRVGGFEVERTIAPGTTAVTLSLTLTAGRHQMQTWLWDEEHGTSRGAFYVEALRMNR